VFDPLTAAETARAALALINEKLGKRPVVASSIRTPHVDHWAGVRRCRGRSGRGQRQGDADRARRLHGTCDRRERVRRQRHVARSQVQYATLLQRNPFGHVDQSIGQERRPWRGWG